MRTVNLRISASHPALAGHFPGTPIVPGVVLLDEVILALTSADGPPRQFQIAAAKFHSPVQPGEALTLEHDLSPDGSTRFVIRAVDRTVASGKLTLAVLARNPELEA